jgi:hypothetical protein
MARSFSRLLGCVITWVAVLVIGASTATAAVTPVSLLEFDRTRQGAAVDVTVAITCDPVGPNTQTYFSLSLFQGTYPHKNYIEGFGGLVEPPPSPTITCDSTRREYTFTVTPSQFYADRRFRPGPATVEYVVQRCTEVEPNTFQCIAEEVVRQAVKITA